MASRCARVPEAHVRNVGAECQRKRRDVAVDLEWIRVHDQPVHHRVRGVNLQREKACSKFRLRRIAVAGERCGRVAYLDENSNESGDDCRHYSSRQG